MTTRHTTHPPAVPLVGRDAARSGGWGLAKGRATIASSKRILSDCPCLLQKNGESRLLRQPNGYVGAQTYYGVFVSLEQSVERPQLLQTTPCGESGMG